MAYNKTRKVSEVEYTIAPMPEKVLEVMQGRTCEELGCHSRIPTHFLHVFGPKSICLIICEECACEWTRALTK